MGRHRKHIFSFFWPRINKLSGRTATAQVCSQINLRPFLEVTYRPLARRAANTQSCIMLTKVMADIMAFRKKNARTHTHAQREKVSILMALLPAVIASLVSPRELNEKMSASFCEVNLCGSVSISGVGVASASAVSSAEKTSDPPTVGGTARER